MLSGYTVFGGKLGQQMGDLWTRAAAIARANEVAQWEPIYCRYWRSWVYDSTGSPIYVTLCAPFYHNGRRHV